MDPLIVSLILLNLFHTYLLSWYSSCPSFVIGIGELYITTSNIWVHNMKWFMKKWLICYFSFIIFKNSRVRLEEHLDVDMNLFIFHPLDNDYYYDYVYICYLCAILCHYLGNISSRFFRYSEVSEFLKNIEKRSPRSVLHP